MEYQLTVENIKCGGCANHIMQKLSELPQVSGVRVLIEVGQVHFTTEPEQLDQVKLRLAELGYPEKDSQQGLNALGSKAKSYVSCAIGRLGQPAK